MRWVWTLALVISAAACAYAGPQTYTFVGFSGGDWQAGYPYYITAGPAGQIIAVMCDDYFHGGSIGQTWQANLTDLGSENLSLTRFNTFAPGPNALVNLLLYDEAGWILLQTIVEPTGDWKDMNSAVWTIFDPSAPCNSQCQSWIAAAQQEGQIGFPGVDFNKVYIITPVNQHDPNPNGMQEFMYIGEDPSGGSKNGSQTPEPGTLVLMATGIMAIFRRHCRQ